MHDSLTTFTNLINSPPGVLVAGSALAGIVWKLFDKVEEKLNDDTKLEMAVWLLELKRKRITGTWSSSFLKVFDRIFTSRHLSFRCFAKSCLASYAAVITCWIVAWLFGKPMTLSYHFMSVVYDVRTLNIEKMTPIAVSASYAKAVIYYSLFVNVFPDYISLRITRFGMWCVSQMRNTFGVLLVIAFQLCLVASIARAAAILGFYCVSGFASSMNPDMASSILQVYLHSPVMPPFSIAGSESMLWYFPVFFTSIWLWLYAASGFILKGARYFDKSLGWFNRRFDIEKKPLSSIGLVAGALVALIYWVAVIVSRVV